MAQLSHTHFPKKLLQATENPRTTTHISSMARSQTAPETVHFTRSTTAIPRLFTKPISTNPTRLKPSSFTTKPSLIDDKTVHDYPFHFFTAENPFVIEGNRNPVYTYRDEEAVYLRVDLPGAKTEGLKVWADKKALYFEAEDAKDDKEFDKESARKFRGQIPLLPLLNSKRAIKDVQAVLNDGVLKVKIKTANRAF